MSWIKTTLKKLEAAYTEANIVMIGAYLLILYEGSKLGKKLPVVNLIDFAHSTVLQNENEKEYIEERRGVLLGLNNIMKILDTIQVN
jgi:hypothetical protein